MDIIAHCTDAGEIVIYASHLAVIDCDEKKLKKQRKVRYIDFLVFIGSNEENHDILLFYIDRLAHGFGRR